MRLRRVTKFAKGTEFQALFVVRNYCKGTTTTPAGKMVPPSRYAAAHGNPNGPGDARPTAMQIIKDEGLVSKLTDKVMLITGCSSGIGVETARALHATGVHLFLTVRDMKKGEQVIQDIQASNKDSQGKMELIKLELDSLQSVREAAADFHKRSSKLNVLINNAGVMACPEGKTKDGFETQFGTNHLGHFLLFLLLKPTLLASSTPSFHSRVVSLSSSGHRNSVINFDDLDLKKMGYNQWTAYGQSKLANIYLANEIERRYGSQGLHATSVHPGGIMTELSRHLDPNAFKSMITPILQLQMKSPEQGAATSVWAAVGREWEGKGGKYLEDCSEAGPVKEGESGPMRKGYEWYAYDEEAAKKLWAISLEMVGMQEDK